MVYILCKNNGTEEEEGQNNIQTKKVEDDSCRMTYMFQPPQYARVRFKKNELFPHYGLYYYYESKRQQDFKKMTLSGAPVIFIPGNSGSYKQVRSLASVALQKAKNNPNNIHLNYFTLDFKEELSGFYGEYLSNQKHFLKLCIEEVIQLYQKFGQIKKSVVLIGHSMGGKVAQAVLQETLDVQYINTIIFISTPMDRPVLQVDDTIYKFYLSNENFLLTRRSHHVVQNSTNLCLDFKGTEKELIKPSFMTSDKFENIVMISIGGGNRDLIVRDSLTISKFSDIHAMTSSIPKVWLSCDHLSAVWCLQLVLVINRFLFDISHTIDSLGTVTFISEKYPRIESGIHFFVKPQKKYKATEVSFKATELWMKNSKLLGIETFNNGLKRFTNFLLSIQNYRQFKKLYIEINGYHGEDWLYACLENDTVINRANCSRGQAIFHYTRLMPTNDLQRTISLIDIEHVSMYFKNWSHIFVRLPPMKKKISIKIDAYKLNDRKFYIKAVSWFQLNPITIISETSPGSTYYQILLKDLVESFHSLKFNILPISCDGGGKHFDVLTKICIPWARGYDRYQSINESTSDKSIYVNVPFDAPSNYNSTVNPISLDVYLDPTCRYKISYHFSVAATTTRIVQRFLHWLPAHITSILLIVLQRELNKSRNTLSRLPLNKPYVEYFQYKSFYMIAGCRLLRKILPALNILTPIAITDNISNSLYVPVILHSTSIVMSIIFVFIIWGIIIFLGNVLYIITSKLGTISIKINCASYIRRILPITIGIMFMGIAWAACSGIALIFAVIYYILLLSNTYKQTIRRWGESTQREQTEIQKKQPEEEYMYNEFTIFENGNNYRSINYSQGLYNFSFHIMMLLLLILMALLNFGITIAWIKSPKDWTYSLESNQFPSFVVLLCLSILLQMDVPRGRSCCRLIAIIFYFSAIASILYCQENIYLLKYIIALDYSIITVLELCIFIFKVLHNKRLITFNK